MKLYVTRGIDGEPVKTLGEAKSKTQAWKKIYEFKDESKKAGEAKVETYDRILKLGEGKLAVDFGDYSRFILIEADHESKKDIAEVEAFWNPPVTAAKSSKRASKLKKK